MGLTREQFSLIVKGLKSVYGMDSFIRDRDAFNMWYALLSDIDYAKLSAGAKKFMQTSNRIPTPADLRNASILGGCLSEGEAWGKVLKALSNSAYHSAEEFQKLPEAIRKAVGSSESLKEWAQLDQESNAVIQSQFLRAYRAQASKDRETELMSPDLQKLLQNKTSMALEDKAWE